MGEAAVIAMIRSWKIGICVPLLGGRRGEERRGRKGRNRRKR